MGDPLVSMGVVSVVWGVASDCSEKMSMSLLSRIGDKGAMGRVDEARSVLLLLLLLLHDCRRDDDDDDGGCGGCCAEES